MSRHKQVDVELFNQIVDLRAKGLTWRSIAKELAYTSHTSLAQVATNYTKSYQQKTTPAWILPSLSDEIIEALRNNQPPPGTAEQISTIRDRAIKQGLL